MTKSEALAHIIEVAFPGETVTEVSGPAKKAWKYAIGYYGWSIYRRNNGSLVGIFHCPNPNHDLLGDLCQHQAPKR